MQIPEAAKESQDLEAEYEAKNILCSFYICFFASHELL